MRIAVYGNLIYDQLITLDTPLVPGSSHNCGITHAAGGIANFCRAAFGHFEIAVVSHIGQDSAGQFLASYLRKYTKTHIPTCNTPTTCASVIIDKAQSMRTGMVQWGACSQIGEWKPQPAVWHHVMYLDRMNITAAELQALPGIVSADVCDIESLAGNAKVESLLPYVDYLIASDPTTWSIDPIDLPTRKGGILHSPENVRYYLKGMLDHVGYLKVDKEENLNVLGAGDYFAAYAINHLLKNDAFDAEVVHQQTLAMIKRQS